MIDPRLRPGRASPSGRLVLAAAALTAAAGISTSTVVAQSALPAVSAAAAPPPYDPGPLQNPLPLAPTAAGSLVGSLAGNFSVGADGSANYSIPLAAIPGPGGMTPSLSLDYSSRAGNGYLGMGFSLSGVAAISRCAKSLAYDGVALGVRTDSTDVFCLNDLRLVLVSGTYGEEGARYRTDPETFADITSHRTGGTPNDGPTSFTVRSKDGLVSEYGGETYDFVGTRRTAWPVTRVSDRMGNRQRYVYRTLVLPVGGVGQGDHVSERILEEIQYGNFVQSGSAETPDRRIRLTYEIRPDTYLKFQYGVGYRLTRRVVKIEMQRRFDDGSIANARSYSLAYRNDGPTGTSKLESVTQCGAEASACLPATRLRWQLGGSGFNAANLQGEGPIAPVELGQPLVPIDFNGDGANDLAYQFDADGNEDGGVTWRILRASTATPFPDNPYSLGHVDFADQPASPPVKHEYPYYLLDYDLDGLTDFLPIDLGANWSPLIVRPNGLRRITTAFAGTINQIPSQRGKEQNRLVDLDGDGYLDVLEFNNHWTYRLRTGKVSPAVQQSPLPADAHDDQAFGPVVLIPELDQTLPTSFTPRMFVLDANGDGRAEIFHCAKPAPGPGDDASGESAPTPAAQPPQPDPGASCPGGSLAELQVLELPNTVYSSGLPKWIMQGQDQNLGTEGVQRLFLDINGDGLVDLLTNVGVESDSVPGSTSGRLFAWLNMGRKFQETPRLVFENAPDAAGNKADLDYAHAIVVDANGDGRDDLLVPNTREACQQASPTSPRVCQTRASAMHLLTAPLATSADDRFVLSRNVIGFTFENMIDEGGAPSEDYRPEFIARYLDNLGPRVVDADGDGLDDVVWMDVDSRPLPHNSTNTDKTLYYRSHARAGELPDRLVAIEEGPDEGVPTVAIAYRSLVGDPDFYRSESCNPLVPAAEPQVRDCATRPYHAVSRVERDAGLAGSGSTVRVVSEYRYRNSITHKPSRKWLGFAERSVKTYPSDGSQGAVTSRYFYTNTDFRRDPRLIETWTYGRLTDNAGTWLERHKTRWASKDTPVGSRLLPFNYVDVDETWSYEFPATGSIVNLDPFVPASLDANADAPTRIYRKVVNDQVLAVDDFGNVRKRRSHFTAGSYQTIVDATYDIDTAAWLVGRPKKVVTTQILAGCASVDCAEAQTSEVVGYATNATGAPTDRLRSTRSYRSDSSPGPVRTVVYDYDTHGNVACARTSGAVDDAGTPAERARCAAYDPDGVFVHAVANELGHVERSLSHPLFGTPAVTVDANGRRTDIQMDAIGRVVKVRSPSGAETLVGYAAEGSQQLTAIEASRATGERRRTVFDRLGRAISEGFNGFDGVMRVRQRAFDAMGRLRREDARPVPAGSPAAPATTYAYDDRNRRLRQVEPNDDDPSHPYTRTWTYDKFVVKYRDSRGNVTQREYDAVGHLGRTTEAYGKPEQSIRDFVWGPFDRLKSSQVFNRPETAVEYTWDERGNLLTRSDADRGLVTSRYNAFDERIFSRDANGRETRFAYDALGRPLRVETTEVTPAASKPLSVLAYTYDVEPATQGVELGKPTRIERTDHLSLVQGGTPQATRRDNDWDALGRLAATTLTLPSAVTPGVPVSYRYAYAYDVFDRVASLDYPKLPGQVRPVRLGYRYSAGNGELAAIDAVDAGVTSTLWALDEVDPANRPMWASFGDGVSRLTLFDTQGRLRSQYLETAAGGACTSCVRGDLRYTYDGEGNLVSREDATQAGALEKFGYDALDRVTTMAMGVLDTPLQTWTYDALGNLTSNTYRGVYRYDDVQRPMRVTSMFGGELGTGRTYAHDAVGNQTGRPDGGVTYNEMNLPSQLVSNGRTIGFLYGPDGERMRKASGTATTTFVGGLYQEVRRGAGIEHRLIVPGVAELAYAQNGGNVQKLPVRYVHTDHQGSVDTVMSDAGAASGATIAERRSYDAFGLKRNPVWTSGSYAGLPPALVEQGYTGHVDDADLGLVDMKGRLYDPLLARFVTADPAVPEPDRTQSWNPYAYVINNPLRHTDPTGFNYCAGCEEFVGAGDALWEGGWGAYVLYEFGALDRAAAGREKTAYELWVDVRNAQLSTSRERAVGMGGVPVAGGICSPKLTLPGFVPAGTVVADVKAFVASATAAGVMTAQDAAALVEPGATKVPFVAVIGDTTYLVRADASDPMERWARSGTSLEVGIDEVTATKKMRPLRKPGPPPPPIKDDRKPEPEPDPQDECLGPECKDGRWNITIPVVQVPENPAWRQQTMPERAVARDLCIARGGRDCGEIWAPLFYHPEEVFGAGDLLKKWVGKMGKDRKYRP